MRTVTAGTIGQKHTPFLSHRDKVKDAEHTELRSLLLLLRVPKNVFKFLELSVVVKFSVLLLLCGSALLHEIQSPVRSRGSSHLRVVDSLELLAHLIELVKILRSTLLHLQELLRKL